MDSTTTNSLNSGDNPEGNRQAETGVAQSSQNNSLLPTTYHPADFFYRPPNDFYHYRIKYNEISHDTILSLLKKLFNDKENSMRPKEDKYIFFYQQEYDSRFYKISCEIFPPLLVNYCLSKN